MSLKLAARLVVLDPTKILDLQENDTVAHTEDISAFVPPGTIAILLKIHRVSGTGDMKLFLRSTAVEVVAVSVKGLQMVTIKNQEFKWANTAANDDWDIFLAGYFVQKRTR